MNGRGKKQSKQDNLVFLHLNPMRWWLFFMLVDKSTKSKSKLDIEPVGPHSTHVVVQNIYWCVGLICINCAKCICNSQMFPTSLLKTYCKLSLMEIRSVLFRLEIIHACVLWLQLGGLVSWMIQCIDYLYVIMIWLCWCSSNSSMEKTEKYNDSITCSIFFLYKKFQYLTVRSLIKPLHFLSQPPPNNVPFHNHPHLPPPLNVKQSFNCPTVSIHPQ